MLVIFIVLLVLLAVHGYSYYRLCTARRTTDLGWIEEMVLTSCTHRAVLRGTIVNRTYGIHGDLYNTNYITLLRCC